MSWFSRRRSRQTPPISLILLLVGFILVAFVFIGFRQLRGAQERRLRLLAGFGERVESTAEDLTDRFVRIVRVPEAEAAEEDLGWQPAGQRDLAQVDRYLKHLPHISLIDLPSECNEGGEGSVALRVIDRDVRLHYCPPQPEQEEEQDANSPRSYLARIDLESLIEPMIVPGAFDSILLADHRGRTLFQQGEPEIRMLDLAPLAESAAERERAEADLAWVKDALGRQGTEVDPEALHQLFTLHENRPLELGSRTAMVEVEIAGSDYFVFLQPVSPRLEPPPGHGAGRPARWIAAGIISSENLLSAGLTTSPFLLFILVSILPLGIIAWPFLKLSLITRRQPFHRLDLAALLFASVVGIALAALLVFDLLFLVNLHSSVDRHLSDLAEAIERSFSAEVLQAREQLISLNDSSNLRPEDVLVCSGELLAEGTPRPPEADLETLLPPRDLGDLTPVWYIQEAPVQPDSLESRNFIKDRITPLLARNDVSIYPYFDSAFWATARGDYGCANLPLREHAVLPQNIRDRAYFRCARDCDPEPFFITPRKPGSDPNLESWRSGDPGPGCGGHILDHAAEDSMPVCLQSLLDRTTGDSVAAIALPGPNEDFPVAALVTRLTSTAHPVLPAGYGFAIVEPGGRVLFHSEARRDLTEDYLKASDENPLLRTMLERRRQGELSLHYWGQPTRIHVQPLSGLPWSLITFRNAYDLRVRNFELIYDFLNPFLLYMGAVLVLSLGTWFFLPRKHHRYLWPSSERLKTYRAIAVSTPVVVMLFGLVLLSDRPTLIFWTSVLTLPAMVLGALLVHGLTLALSGHRTGKAPDGSLTIPSRQEGPSRSDESEDEIADGETPEEEARGGSASREKDTRGGENSGQGGETSLWARTQTGFRSGWKALRVKDRTHRAWKNVGEGKLNKAWDEKRPWLPLGTLLILVGAVLWLLLRDVPVMPVLSGALAASLVGALAWYWHGFSGKRRKIAFVFASGCVLLLVGLLPALGFLHLARSRQIQLHTQDAQMSLAQRLEQRRAEIEKRQGPLTDLYRPYTDELAETRYAYLKSFFRSSSGWASELGKPTWPYGIERAGGRADLVIRLLSARPFPLNDLSARPVESDLSRFEAAKGSWGRPRPGRLTLAYPTHEGTGKPIFLASSIPVVETLPEELGIKTGLVLLGLLLLAGSPFVLSRFLADRVLLISLVGRPVGQEDGRYTTAPASTPVGMILEDVRTTSKVVRQVVLVSTLPGPSAWRGHVEGDDESSEPRQAAPPRFLKGNFRKAWRTVSLEASGPTVTDKDAKEATQTGETARQEHKLQVNESGSTTSTEQRADRFYDRLLDLEVDEGEPDQDQDAPETSRDQDPALGRPGRGDERGVDQVEDLEDEKAHEEKPHPVLITHFDPALDDPEAAADQVAALRKLSVEDGRSVVILAETIPDPEVIPGRSESQRSTRARRLWTELLATYGVEYGHDSQSYDIKGKVSVLYAQVEEIFQNWKLPGGFREDLRAIQHNLRWIGRECSPTPVLRNIGWSLLNEIEDVLPGLEQDIKEEASRTAVSPADHRDMQGRIEQLLAQIRESEEAQEQQDPQEESGDWCFAQSAAAQELVMALIESFKQAHNPVVLLRRGALSVADHPSEGFDFLKQVEQTLTEEMKSRLDEDSKPMDEGATKEWDDAISYIRKAQEVLWDEFIASEIRRERIQWARNLLQLTTREHIVTKVGASARLHYRYLWSRCTTDEKLVLVQLAQNGLVNPKYDGWVMDLMNRGLVVRDPELRVINESFRRFVLQEVKRSQILEWEEEEGPSGWSIFKWILPAPLILVAAFLFITQRDALSNVTGVLVAAISLAPVLVNLYGQFREVSARREAKEETKDIKDEGSDKSSK